MFIASFAKYEALRDKKGVTDYRVSIDTSIPKSTFSEWKNGDTGRSVPKVDKLVKLAAYFGVTVEDLLEEVEDE